MYDVDDFSLHSYKGHRPIDDATRLLLDLFADVPHVMVCAKDEDGRYVGANGAFARRARRRNVAEVIGARASDLFPAELAASYEAQDRALLLTGREVRNHPELIASHDGDPHWYVTTKTLRVTPTGPIVLAVSVETRLGAHDDPAGLRAAVELAHARFAQPITVGDLAAAAGMSTDRLERAMRRALGISPKRYLLRLRAEQAARLLATTDLTIGRIAVDCGYYDQSQLTRQFRDHIGIAPSTYRATARS